MEGKVEIQYEMASYASTATTALAWAFVTSTRIMIDSVSCHFSAAPTAADVFQVSYIPAITGSASYTYGATIYAVTASTGGNGTTKDIFWQPTNPLKLAVGDTLKIMFTNTNALTYGVMINAISNTPS